MPKRPDISARLREPREMPVAAIPSILRCSLARGGGARQAPAGTAVKLAALFAPVALFAGTTGFAFSQQKLSPETLAAFDQFIERVEQSMSIRQEDGSVFLWLAEDQTRLDATEEGDFVIERLDDDAGLDGAMIHNWIGGMFVRGVAIDDVLTVFLDYDRYPDIYPGVVESRLLESDGNSNRLYQRLRRDDLVLDTWHEAGYRELDAGRAVTWSRSTEIREVRNAGESDEEILPDGEGGGYMWRIHVYWRLEQRQDGVFAECHSISMSRDIPFLLRWIVAPFVRRIPRQGLERSLEATRVEAQRVSQGFAAPGVN